MKKHGETSYRRGPVVVSVHEYEGEPIDLDAWMRRYVAAVIRIHGDGEAIPDPVATTPAVSVG